ncbi:MAG: hypothetical protein UT24_C0030G0019 [Candidatus Woesebacteria bacterium GW2011_GWB1_39_12]|uniref:Uncharacterized protein n=1 Tax=Candidatus Woesebacteria bacterium GW2011_GWB1_39_12 TaxID=1618574 RepID=A0A0G0QB58_9BACT|nr:MAG: hypothetical protein UT24_C0030G0019 [Candidatus Woesebacteria bacterium GW2011_GWB1_39_12]
MKRFFKAQTRKLLDKLRNAHKIPEEREHRDFYMDVVGWNFDHLFDYHGSLAEHNYGDRLGDRKQPF